MISNSKDYIGQPLFGFLVKSILLYLRVILQTWSVDWLIGWLVGKLDGWLVDRSVIIAYKAHVFLLSCYYEGQ